jgi:hypothetical protein
MPPTLPTAKENRRWTQLRALTTARPGFTAIADGLILPECQALPLAEAIPQLEEMLTRMGIAIPAPEPEPAVEPVQPLAPPARLGDLLPPTTTGGANRPGEYERLAIQLEPVLPRCDRASHSGPSGASRQGARIPRAARADWTAASPGRTQANPGG